MLISRCRPSQLTITIVQITVGTLPKDKMTGKFVMEWTAVLASSSIKLDEVDVATGVASLLAVKDEQEIVS